MRIQIDVQVWRGSIPECVHRVQAAVSDPAGVLAVRTPSADQLTSFRSAAKPFQLLPLVERGHADRWRFPQEELAIMAASHTGSPHHVALVRRILERIGQPASLLACGYHDPVDAESLRHLAAHPEERGPLYNNCSGKHAGMLCLALSEGWPLEGYERAEHPLQRLMRESVAEACGFEAQRLLIGVDGCSVPVFGLPLSAMARSYAVFAAAKDGGSPRERALFRIRRAMQEFPAVTEGEGRLSTEIMKASSGRLVAKGGAEGLHCTGIPERGLGIALKVEDGAARAVGPAVLALLEHLGAISPASLAMLATYARPAFKNVAGLEAGFVEAEIRTLATASP
jgi:L-asparaginase II